MSTVACQNLQRRFGRDTLAVAGLDLEVEAGEIFGFIGPDGAGKTTTLRMLAAVLKPTSGKAFVAGYDVVRYPERIRHQVGYMAQHFSLYGDLSVLENINFFADIFGVYGHERRQRIERLLHFARLEAFTSRDAGNLSGGMKKKLALACALIHRPNVLLLDEPTNGVDPVSRREFWDILSELHLEGVTIVVSTPYMDEAERCSRVALMHQGLVIRQGTPVELRSLVPGQMLAVYTTDLHSAEAAVVHYPGYVEHQVYGDRLHVFVPDAAAARDDLSSYLTSQNVRFSQILLDTPRLEEAFIHVMSTSEWLKVER